MTNQKTANCLLSSGLTSEELLAEYDMWVYEEEMGASINDAGKLGIEELNMIMSGKLLDIENTIKQRDHIIKAQDEINAYYGNKVDGVLSMITHDPLGWGKSEALEGMVFREQGKNMNKLAEAFEAMSSVGGVKGNLLNRSHKANQQDMIKALYGLYYQQRAYDETGKLVNQASYDRGTDILSGIKNTNAIQWATSWKDVVTDVIDQINERGGVYDGKISRKIKELPDWIVGNSHHTQKIHKFGRENWVDYMMTNADIPRMKMEMESNYSRWAKLNDKPMKYYDDPVMREELGRIWDNIVSGGDARVRTYLPDDPDKVKEKVAGLIDRHSGMRGLTAERVIHFADPDKWWAYNEKFGQNDPWEMMTVELDRLGAYNAAMEKFGPRPHETAHYLAKNAQIEQVREVHFRQLKGKDTGFDNGPTWMQEKLTSLTRLGPRKMMKMTPNDVHQRLNREVNQVQAQMEEIVPVEQTYGNRKWAERMASWRLFNTGTLLPHGTLIDSIPTDTTFFALQSMYNGMPVMKSLTGFYNTWMRMGQAERHMAAQQLLTEATYVSNLLTRTTRELDSLGFKGMQDYTTVMLRMSGLNKWTNSMMQGAQFVWMTNLSRDLKTFSWQDLDKKPRTKRLKRSLERAGITEDDYEILKMDVAYNAPVPGGAELIDLADFIKRSTKGEAWSAGRGPDGSITERHKSPRERNAEFRSRHYEEIANKLSTWAITHARQSVLNVPGVRLKQGLMQGDAPGTLSGEAKREVFHLRGFGWMSLFNQMGILVGDENGTRFGKYAGGIAAVSVANMLAYQAKEMLAGREPLALDDQKMWAESTFNSIGALNLIGLRPRQVGVTGEDEGMNFQSYVRGMLPVSANQTINAALFLLADGGPLNPTNRYTETTAKGVTGFIENYANPVGQQWWARAGWQQFMEKYQKEYAPKYHAAQKKKEAIDMAKRNQGVLFPFQ